MLELTLALVPAMWQCDAPRGHYTWGATVTGLPCACPRKRNLTLTFATSPKNSDCSATLLVPVFSLSIHILILENPTVPLVSPLILSTPTIYSFGPKYLKHHPAPAAVVLCWEIDCLAMGRDDGSLQFKSPTMW